jgi:hypothetical protein
MKKTPWYLKSDWHDLVRKLLKVYRTKMNLWSFNEQDWQDAELHVIYRIYRYRKSFNKNKGGLANWIRMSCKQQLALFIKYKFRKKRNLFAKSVEFLTWANENELKQADSNLISRVDFNSEYISDFKSYLTKDESEYLDFKFLNLPVNDYVKQTRKSPNTLKVYQSSIESKYFKFINDKQLFTPKPPRNDRRIKRTRRVRKRNKISRRIDPNGP